MRLTLYVAANFPSKVFNPIEALYFTYVLLPLSATLAQLTLCMLRWAVPCRGMGPANMPQQVFSHTLFYSKTSYFDLPLGLPSAALARLNLAPLNPGLSAKACSVTKSCLKG